jgi:hypothetical protein
MGDSGVISVIVVVLLSAAVYVWLALALAEVFRKLNEDALPAWIPGWNLAVLLQVGGYSPWLVFLALVPFVGPVIVVVFLAVACHRISAGFGYGSAMTVVALLWFPIWASVLAWGPASWSGASRIRPYTSPATARSIPQHSIPQHSMPQDFASSNSVPSQSWGGFGAPGPVNAQGSIWTAVPNPVIANPAIPEPASGVTRVVPPPITSWTPPAADPVAEMGMTQVKPLFVDEATPGGGTPAAGMSSTGVPQSAPPVVPGAAVPGAAVSGAAVPAADMPVSRAPAPRSPAPELTNRVPPDAPPTQIRPLSGTAADLVASAFDRQSPMPGSPPASQLDEVNPAEVPASANAAGFANPTTPENALITDDVVASVLQAPSGQPVPEAAAESAPKPTPMPTLTPMPKPVPRAVAVPEFTPASAPVPAEPAPAAQQGAESQPAVQPPQPPAQPQANTWSAPKPDSAGPVLAVPAVVVPDAAQPSGGLPEDADRTMLAARFRPTWSLTDLAGHEIELTGSEAILGRKPNPQPEAADAQLVALADPTRTVSKSHALLQLIQGVWFVQDLGSTNGVILVDADGNERLLEADVEPLTERFFLGDAEYRLTSGIDPSRLR